MPTKLTRKRRDVTLFATEESLRRKGGVLLPRNWRCLGELSAMLLVDKAGEEGRDRVSIVRGEAGRDRK